VKTLNNKLGILLSLFAGADFLCISHLKLTIFLVKVRTSTYGCKHFVQQPKPGGRSYYLMSSMPKMSFTFKCFYKLAHLICMTC